MASKKPLAIIYTEGKTDWQLLQKAHEKLNLHLDIEFYNFSHRMGDEELLGMCRAYARQPHPEQVQIFVFDRDNPKIINDVKGKDNVYKVWENNVFSFPIPIPAHRSNHESISIEFYFTDDEIKTTDTEGRRLFLSSEFDKSTGGHKDDPAIHVINQKDVKDYTEYKKAKIVDAEIGVVKGNQHIALSKGKFTKYICEEVPPFDKVNFEPFRKIFDIIEDIIQNEFLPSIQSECLEELPSRFFIGREAQFELFEKYVKRNQPVSIEGLGGIGKTAFAEKCIERFGLADRAVWFPCTRESKLESLIETAGFSDLLKIENLTERAKYSGFASLLDRHEKMVFLDDFQEITDSSFAKFLQFVKEYSLQKGKFILIAREHPEIRVLTSPIRLQGLEVGNAFAYAQHILDHNYPELDIDEEDIRAISQQFKGHPLAIELAIYLLDFGASPEHLLQAVIDYEDEEFLARRLLDEIFTHPKSTQEEKEFMLAFSVFRGKVKEQAFTYLFEGKDLNSIIRRLRRKLMLLSEDGSYETHPLVREFCYDRLSDKQDWHKKAAEYFQSQRTEQLDPELEEKIFYHLSSSTQWQAIIDLICARGEQFLLAGYTDILKEIMDASSSQGRHSPQFDLFYGEIAEIQGEWDQALSYFEQAFSAPEANEKVQALGRIQYGEILSRKGDVKGALTYFEQGYEMCRAIHFQRGEVRSLNDIGLAYKFLGNLSFAKKKIEEGLKLSQQIGNISDIADSLNNLGIILHDQGNLQGAWEKFQESQILREKSRDKSGMATSLNNLGSILHAQGDLQGAREKYQRSLQLREEMGEKSGMALSLNNLGGILHDQGELQGALEKYQGSLQLCEEIGEKSGIAVSLSNLGRILHDQGKLQGAREKYQRSLQLREEIGEKSGMAASLNNLGGILLDQEDLQGAWDKFQNSLKLYEEIGKKSGIAMSLNNLGHILQDQGDLQGAWEKYQHSLHLNEEIGDKSGIANSLHNLGTLAYSEKKKDYALALQYFLKSKMLLNQIGIPGQETEDYIFEIRRKLGLLHFKIAVQEALRQLPDDAKEYVDIEKFTQDTTVRRTEPKVGRNDPCPCGSGKKYKKCCGR